MDKKVKLPTIQSKHLNNNQLPIPNINVTPDTSPSNYCYQNSSITSNSSIIDDTSRIGSPSSSVLHPIPNNQYNLGMINDMLSYYSYPSYTPYPYQIVTSMSTGQLFPQPISQFNPPQFNNTYQQSSDVYQGKSKKKARIDRKCLRCGTSDTPEWRTGPYGSKTLCNACGLYHYKLVKKKGILFANNELLKYKIVLDSKGRRVAVDADKSSPKSKAESPLLEYSPNHQFQYHPINTSAYSSQEVTTPSPGQMAKK